VREQVEALEDHADVPALQRDLAVLELVQLVALLAVADQLTVDGQPAGVDLLQVVDAPQEGRLAGAGGADEAEDLAGLDLQVDALEDLDRADLWTPSDFTIGVPEMSLVVSFSVMPPLPDGWTGTSDWP
jgi:hypothetical protein